jgi:hypothetical protein
MTEAIEGEPIDRRGRKPFVIGHLARTADLGTELPYIGRGNYEEKGWLLVSGYDDEYLSNLEAQGCLIVPESAGLRVYRPVEEQQ